METNNLIVTVNTLIKLYENREIELKIQKEENKLLKNQLELLKKELVEKTEESKAVNKSKQEVREIFEEIKKGEKI